MQGVRSALLLVLAMLLVKEEKSISAKQSAKWHYLRRFALLLALTPTVRTPGLDPAGANGGPHPSLRWQSSDRAQQCRRSISRLSGGLPTSMLPLTRSVCRGFWSDSTHGKQGPRHQPLAGDTGGHGMGIAVLLRA